MQLNQYPDAIREGAIEILDQEAVVRGRQAIVDEYILSIENTVAFDSELKNEQQRKVRRAELLMADEHQAIANGLQQAKDDLAEMRIVQQCLCDRFKVARLEIQLTIANQQAIAA